MSKGTTDTVRTGSDGEPPFQAGDIVKFRCNSGYTLAGYSTVTCSGASQWSYDLPTCTYQEEGATVTASGVQGLMNCGVFVLLTAVLLLAF